MYKVRIVFSVIYSLIIGISSFAGSFFAEKPFSLEGRGRVATTLIEKNTLFFKCLEENYQKKLGLKIVMDLVDGNYKRFGLEKSFFECTEENLSRLLKNKGLLDCSYNRLRLAIDLSKVLYRRERMDEYLNMLEIALSIMNTANYVPVNTLAYDYEFELCNSLVLGNTVQFTSCLLDNYKNVFVRLGNRIMGLKNGFRISEIIETVANLNPYWYLSNLSCSYSPSFKIPSTYGWLELIDEVREQVFAVSASTKEKSEKTFFSIKRIELLKGDGLPVRGIGGFSVSTSYLGPVVQSLITLLDVMPLNAIPFDTISKFIQKGDVTPLILAVAVEGYRNAPDSKVWKNLIGSLLGNYESLRASELLEAIVDVFGNKEPFWRGKTLLLFKCKECRHFEGSESGSFASLNCRLKEKEKLDLEERLEKEIYRKEEMDGYCSFCKRKVKWSKETLIEQTPAFLLFTVKKNGKEHAVDSDFKCNEKLTLKWGVKNEKTENYKLVTVIDLCGFSSGGYYRQYTTSVLGIDNCWYTTGNDGLVKKITGSLISPSACAFLYKKCKN